MLRCRPIRKHLANGSHPYVRLPSLQLPVLEASQIIRARNAESCALWTINRYLSVFCAAFILDDAVFGVPMLTGPATNALTPPTAASPSSPATIWPTNGPTTRTGPILGMVNAAKPNRSPQNPPRMRRQSPILHAIARVVIANHWWLWLVARAYVCEIGAE